MNAIFKDLKVLELASVLAGPAVGMFFAELGATVLKIENAKVGGDVTRTWKLASESKEAAISAYYCAINWNKEVLMLDLEHPEDKERVYNLVKEADVVIANYKKSSAEKLGMDYESLKKLNPQLIYANISGFGEESDRVAFDVVLQAESGFMFMNGQADGPPTKMPVALIDVLAAHQLKEGVLVALLQRYKTGKGAYVSVSLLEAAIASLANQATNWLMNNQIPQRIGSLHPNIAPYGEIFQTKDGKSLILAIGSNAQFTGLSECLNRPDLLTQDAYKNNALRVENRTKLADELAKSFLLVEAAPLLQKCHEKFVPIGQIRNMQEVFELDSAKGMVLEEVVEKVRTKRVKTVAFEIENDKLNFKIIEARVKRNKFAELAGVFFQDNNSQLVKDLNSKNKKALLGIQKENGIYTVIGEEAIYYSTTSGIEGTIPHTRFLKILKENAMSLGKKNNFEFLKINEQDSVWLLNSGTMNAMWNTILLLEEMSNK